MPTPFRLAAALGLALGVVAPVHAQAPAPAVGAAPDAEHLSKVVADTERAFAKTMADRDLAAFSKFLAADTVFQGPKAPLRGAADVTAAWKRFFEGPQAPFSWEPDNVLVMTDGKLAISSGPVRDPSGKVTARFNSVWRQEAPGVWRIILDMGNDACDCPKQ